MADQITQSLYAQYLASPAWQARRVKRLGMDGGQCQGCGRQDDLHVHHTTYIRFGSEPLDDLITVCGLCHSLIHQIQRRTRRPLAVVTAEVLRLIAVSPVYRSAVQAPDHTPRHVRDPRDWREDARNGGTWARGAKQQDEAAASRRINGI